MQLNKIKLAGFKSFVDPTIVVLPSNLVAVVGPNGCGKSNIIDAVLWVMGESSAKHLRGDLMSDVIFNGSASRKPVSKAFVELLFENTGGKLGGQYANYSEIAVRREISRDGISTYYLNGSRCRRRDILDVFLGTGLGPGSYAIIEQGTITRLVEAKPDELRFFIEEAAGISKYKEKRRETERRMERTRENIARLQDVRGELAGHLEHLQAQAKAAERYQSLKRDERRLDAELHALDWRGLTGEVAAETERVVSEETRVEAALAGLRKIESAIESHRHDLSAANEACERAQRDFYGASAAVSQGEQNIQHTEGMVATVSEDLANAKQQLADGERHHQQDARRLKQLVADGEALTPEREACDAERTAAQAALHDTEQAMQAWQIEWDACNAAVAERTRQEEVDAARLEYLQQGIEEARQRQQRLREELGTLDSVAVRAIIGEAGERLQGAGETHARLVAQIDKQRVGVSAVRDEIEALRARANEHAYEAQNVDGRLASLEALQQAAYGHDQAALGEWLTRVGLADRPRLAEQLEVEPAWLRAVDIVLRGYLHDIVVDNDTPLVDELAALSDADLGVIAARTVAEAMRERAGMTRLSEKIKNFDALSEALSPVLGMVFVANDADDAKRLCGQLQRGESVITRDGLWLGAGWVRIVRGRDEKNHVLTRQKEIESLIVRREILRNEHAKVCADLDAKGATRDALEQSLRELQEELQRNQEVLSSARESLAAAEAQRDQILLRTQAINESLANLATEIEDDVVEMTAVRDRSHQAVGDDANADRQRLIDAKAVHDDALTAARRRWQQAEEHSHQVALRIGSINAEQGSLEQAMVRSERHIAELHKRCDVLETALGKNRKSLTALQTSRHAELQARMTAEKVLAEARQSLASVEVKLRDAEQQKGVEDQRIADVRAILETARLSLREHQVRAQTVADQLAGDGHDVASLLAALPKDAGHEMWRQKRAKLEKKINRLMPINLAAIDEFAKLSERQRYLDSQHQDLEDALKTLQDAMRKIDHETRTRFKETFDRINDKLGEKFPQLFGGGRAYLDLTDQNLLQAGVTIMARPPGKKNSTIHLLSGGEKALTAVALIFSIFELNPSPFCLLDEVDAPLDDENVQRYSEMVEHMSASMQFVVVTHNKITMEAAHQLLGVTMHEAGVSRLVSVDIDEAVRMVANA